MSFCRTRLSLSFLHIIIIATAAYFLQGGAFDAEVNQLRVRRLEDGSETWLCRDSVQLEGYRWITNRELVKH